MQKMLWLVPMVVLGIGASAAEPAAPMNLLKNGDLEIWRNSAKPLPGLELKDNLTVDFGGVNAVMNENAKGVPARVERDVNVRRSGRYSLKITNPDPANIIVLQQYDFPVEPKTRYRFSCWVKGQGLTPRQGHGVWGALTAGPATDFWSRKTGTFVGKPEWSGDFDWRKFEAELTTREQDRVGLVTIQLRLRTGTLWIDDLMLEELE